ncbi:MAG: DUF559 domain-containing protein [Patescibacteria group bacterium]
MQSHITKIAYELGTALREKGIKLELEHWDGHKHVDIFIPSAGLCIEVDGAQHYTNADQILRDLERAHYSDDDGQRTMHIPNEIVTTHFKKVVDAIAKTVSIRHEEISNGEIA